MSKGSGRFVAMAGFFFIAGCAIAPGGPDETRADEAQLGAQAEAAKAPRPPATGISFAPGPTPPGKPGKPGAAPLTVVECANLHGTVVIDNSCPETTTKMAQGGAVVGKFRCRTQGGGSNCIDEDTK